MFINKIEKYTVFIAITLFINGSCSSPFAKLSNSIKKQTSEKTKLMNQIRKDLYKKKVLNFINLETDTVYLISLWEYESGFIYGKIWNREGNVNYSYGQSNLQIRKDNYPFKDETLELINTWDKDKIKGSQPKGIVLPSYTIEAVRVILKNQKVLVDTISIKY
ncbi:MAG: hypothetical protein WBJ37_04735 [Bacteroidales bacterium]